MKLYVTAESKNNIGYTPDWLKVLYEKNGQELELTLDIHGEISYDENSLNCRCKGNLIPWVLYNLENGKEIDLSNLDEEELEEEFDEMFSIKRIVEILQNGTYFTIGVFPVNTLEENLKLAEEDVFSNCHGELYIYDGENEHMICFEFDETEVNI